MSENLYETFERRFPADDRAAVLETAEGVRYSYRTLAETSGRYARFLGDLGVGPGDRIAAQVEKSPEALFLFLASLRLGAIFLPINPAYRRSEVAYFVEDAEPSVVVCDPSLEETTAELARSASVGSVLTLDAGGLGSLAEGSRALDGDFATVARSGDDVAAILYTSGTTGRPKGAMLTHRNLASNILTLHRAWGFRPDDVLLHALPLFHTHGLFVAAGCVLAAGARMVFLPRFDAESVVRLLPGASVFMGVPTYYVRLLQHDGFGREACRNMRLFVSGSAPLLVETFRSFHERTGHTILERYGMSETTMNTSNPLVGERREGTVGLPLPGIEIRVAADDGRVLAPGEVGVIEVRGPNVFKGYWRQAEKTASEFGADGFFVTGDLGTIDERGYVSIVGRAKDMIITGGLNVYPHEVEAVIDGIEGIEESAVIGLPHRDFGEAVAAVVRCRANVPPPPADAVIQRVKRELANYKVPKGVFFVDDLPRNAMGKVQKNALRERYRLAFREGGG